jgi:integrase
MNSSNQSFAGRSAAISGAATPTSSLTVSGLIDRYMLSYAGRDASRTYRLRWWQSKIGESSIADLTDDHVFHLLEALAERPARVYAGKDVDGNAIYRAKSPKLSPATLNRYQHSLAAVCTWAIRKRLVPKGWEHPCKRIERRREDNERVRFLSNGEREVLLTACKASGWRGLYPLVMLAITTGARRGELMGLRVRDVDLDAATASIETSKNGDRRVMPLVPTVVAELTAIMPTSPDARVFGSRLRADVPFHFEGVWRLALEAARIKNFRFHDLRHSCASYLAQSGSTLLEIADVLGHRNLAVTRRYSHLTVKHKTAMINRVLGNIK